MAKYKKCPFCKNPLKLYGKSLKLFGKTCGNRVCITKRTQQTNRKKYGHVCNLHSEKGHKQVLNSLKKRYGDSITNISQIQFVKEKKIQTCKSNFGVNHPMQSPHIMKKSKETCMKKYGVERACQDEEIKKRIYETKFTKDPITGLSSHDMAIKKIKRTLLKRYGVTSYFQTEEWQKKYQKTMMQKYGVTNFRKSKEFHQMMIDMGLRYTIDDIKKRSEYYRLVWIYTNISYRKYKNILEINNRRSNIHHLDHLYSISEGFKNNIDPKLLGCISNLHILNATKNRLKYTTCWITLKQLQKLYNKLDVEDKFLLIEDRFLE